MACIQTGYTSILARTNPTINVFHISFRFLLLIYSLHVFFITVVSTDFIYITHIQEARYGAVKLIGIKSLVFYSTRKSKYLERRHQSNYILSATAPNTLSAY